MRDSRNQNIFEQIKMKWWNVSCTLERPTQVNSVNLQTTRLLQMNEWTMIYTEKHDVNKLTRFGKYPKPFIEYSTFWKKYHLHGSHTQKKTTTETLYILKKKTVIIFDVKGEHFLTLSNCFKQNIFNLFQTK